MVILLHSGSTYLVVVDRPDRIQWAIIHAVEAGIQVCVPLFFMISGALLINRVGRRPLTSVKRAVVPLIFYTLVAVLYLWAFKGQEVADTLQAAWSSKAFYHLWFFYPLIGIYVCFYFLSAPISEPGKRALAVLIFMMLLGGGAELVARTYSVGSRLFVDGMFFGFLLFGFLGHYLRHWMEEDGDAKITTPLLTAVLVAAWGCTVVLSRMSNEFGVRYDSLFFVYQSPNMVFQSAVAFVLLKRMGNWLESTTRLRVGVSFVAQLSLGLFGIHAFVMDALRFHTPLGLRSEYAVIHFVGLFILTTIISLVIAFAIGRLDRGRLVV